jgi:uncharacterized small protein (DUF1192 family)
VEGALTGTFHDGRNMIVLTEDVKTAVAESSLEFLRSKGAIKKHVQHLPQLDHDDNGEAGGSIAATGDADKLAATRARYKSVIGKQFFGSWDVAELERRIALFEAEQAAAQAAATGDADDASGEAGEDFAFFSGEGGEDLASLFGEDGEDFASGEDGEDTALIDDGAPAV